MITEVDLNKSTLTIIQGKNGSGKSTLLDAICFALFGKPYRKINKPQLVNNKNKKDMLVEIDFTSSGVAYKIIRGQNPAIFQIYKDGNLVDQNAANSDYQSYLEKYILKYDYGTFTQLVIIGKAMYVSFLKLDASKRRTFIENMLSLTIFGSMSDVHKKKVSDLKIKLNDTNTNLKILNEKISVRKKYVNDLEANFRKQQEDSVARINSEIQHFQDDIKKCEEEIKKLQNSYFDIDEDKVTSIRNTLDKLFDFRSKFSMKLSQLHKDKNFFLNNDFCPSCNQIIDDSLKSKMSAALTDKSSKSLLGLERTKSDIAKFELELNNLLEMSKKNSLLNIECKNLNHTISGYITRILNLENTKKDSSLDYSKIEKEQLELETLIDEQTTILIEKDNLLDRSNYYELITSMLKDTGIKSMVIKKFVPVINDTINKYLRQLGFFIKFVLDENFNEKIYSRGIDEMNYYNYSEGEKLRIDLAILLAWRELVQLQGNNVTNLIIFDEILDASMDQSGSDNFLYMINAMNNSNIFIVSHSESKWADKTIPKILFEKVKGYSKMQYA